VSTPSPQEQAATAEARATEALQAADAAKQQAEEAKAKAEAARKEVATKKPADAMVTEVAKAYYPRAVAAADAARTRAQAGYTIASAIAAALVAAGIFGGIEDFEPVVQGLGVLALVGWLLAGFFFVLAVSNRRPDPEESKDPQKLDEHKGALPFIREVMSDAKRERNAVEEHQKRAVVSTAAAMVLTVATIIGVLVDQPADASKSATFGLSASGAAAVDAVCDRPVSTLEGSVDPAKLDQDFVPIAIEAGSCVDDETTLHLSKRQISTVAVAP
jgi:hypothetical protein